MPPQVDLTLPVPTEPAPKKRKGKFSRVPKLIEKRGRAAGFTRVRDKLLKDWEYFSAVSKSPLAVLKTVIEMDRHAMFAEVQAQKASKHTDEAYEKFQKYLEGDTDGLQVQSEEEKAVDAAVDVIDTMVMEHAEELERKEEIGKDLD